MRTLLMGGQACVLRGAAEFSRDVDLAVAVSPGNLDRLRRALAELKAEPVFFPALSEEVLRRGHACHFRCMAPGMDALRVDVMTVMRGADPFERLWRRRETARIPGAGSVPVLAFEDLVVIKKTQRDKDWPMVRRLLEADIVRGGAKPSRRAFWLQECRTPELLVALAGRYPALARRLSRRRPALAAAVRGNAEDVARRIREEEDREREADRRYWAPLKAELERWRRERDRRPS